MYHLKPLMYGDKDLVEKNVKLISLWHYFQRKNDNYRQGYCCRGG